MSSALVTGAGRGLGAAIAARLSRDGWRVGVLDRDDDLVRDVAAAIDGAVPLTADIVDDAAVEAALDRLGEVPNVVVNNAGIVRFGPLLDLSLADFRAVVDVNLVGTFTVARAAARRMMAAGMAGSIINITSMNGVAPGPNGGAYGAAKAGIALLTQQMAIEWGRSGIRVNAVAPGMILAGMSEPVFADPVIREARESKVPLGRLGTAEDIASMVAFLASDGASYVTGQNILVDGGVTMSMIANLPRPASVDKVGIR
jgi:NAD(P)-dependent dehydrogenase (short-subunit alcohol dehydrogenase family)